MNYMFRWCRKITELPVMDLGNALNAVEFAAYCDALEDIRKIKNKEIKGFIIKVTRNLSSSENYTHESETVDVDYDFLIENNKSTMELYYKVISIVSGIKKSLM